jgi:hypothetical protein
MADPKDTNKLSSEYHVNAADFDARVRPNSAERIRSAFEASAHTKWMREKAAASLADPRPNIPHAQLMATAQALIDSKRKQHADKAAS